MKFMKHKFRLSTNLLHVQNFKLQLLYAIWVKTMSKTLHEMKMAVKDL
jgi:hypothetical protein